MLRTALQSLKISKDGIVRDENQYLHLIKDILRRRESNKGKKW